MSSQNKGREWRRGATEVVARPGHWWDPYNQHVLKGDYPIIGQHTFFEILAVNTSLFEVRQVPIPTTPFESTTRPGRNEFFGSPNQFFFTNFLSVGLDLFHGDAA